MPEAINVINHKAFLEYMKTMSDLIKLSFPYLVDEDIDSALEYSIQKRYKQETCEIDNNYTKKKASMSLVELTDYIIEREPIVTAWGVLWKRKGTTPNPLIDMIRGFMDNRNILKGKMFKAPKGSEEFEKYNLLQLLAKLDANGTLTN